MNKIGKILVFVNLLFSLITGALIVMVFFTRTQWERGYQNAVRQLAGERTRFTALLNDREKQIASQTEQLKQNDQNLKKKDADLIAAEKGQTAARTAQKQAEQKAEVAEAQAGKLQAQVTGLHEELKQKDALVTRQLTTINDLELKAKNATDQMVKYKIASESTRARNENLVAQIEKMLKEVESLRTDRAARSNTLVNNPPPEDVKGSIKASDPHSGLLTVNLGSDNGLSKGNTLHVYRLSPRPTYVGQMRIMDVRPHEAVGKLVSAARASSVQIGDEVASKILENR